MSLCVILLFRITQSFHNWYLHENETESATIKYLYLLRSSIIRLRCFRPWPWKAAMVVFTRPSVFPQSCPSRLHWPKGLLHSTFRILLEYFIVSVGVFLCVHICMFFSHIWHICIVHYLVKATAWLWKIYVATSIVTLLQNPHSHMLLYFCTLLCFRLLT